jgi:hypothetical protein
MQMRNELRETWVSWEMQIIKTSGINELVAWGWMITLA